MDSTQAFHPGTCPSMDGFLHLSTFSAAQRASRVAVKVCLTFLRHVVVAPPPAPAPVASGSFATATAV